MSETEDSTMVPDAEVDYDPDYLAMVPALQVPSAIGIGFLILITSFGNIITIIAFVRDTRLHTVYDFYIFNLAFADLLIGCISMPFYAVYTLKEFQWDFGKEFCKAWLAIDFTMCFESVLLILIISLDRLLLFVFGPHYTSTVTFKRAIAQVAFSWLVSFLLYGPAIIGWDHWVGYSTVEYMDCTVEFAYNFEYTTITAILEFVLPVTGLVIINFLIYRKISGRFARQRSNRVKPTTDKGNVVKRSNCEKQEPQSSGDQLDKANRNVAFENGEQIVSTSSSTGANTSTQSSKSIREIKQIKQENKAARFLAILVLVFLATWAPYTITTIVLSFCGDDCVNTSAYESMNWILWGKSAINPFLYAMNSQRYRYNFKKYICCWKKQAQPQDNTCQTIA
ncbi:muscarinic acetylcholine receptor M5-like [Mya arenaria]|uniref:muscarinic acetylcholine receptor M5-like n=1 Tax=Mya arenaria TaxID=6604 RepID=UPI0022E258BE|nr:muscarinic acetylcholine receptor M5-like [Mya arenaria]